MSNEFYISNKQNPHVSIENSDETKKLRKQLSNDHVIPGGFGLTYGDRKKIKRKVMEQFENNHKEDSVELEEKNRILGIQHRLKNLGG